MRKATTFRAGDPQAHSERMATPRKKSVCAVVIASPVPDARGAAVALARATTILERVASTRVEDDWMSRYHASVWRTGGNVYLRDGAEDDDGWRGSANGTWVGAQRLAPDETLELDVGDVFRTGRTLWMVVENPTAAPKDSLLAGISHAIAAARDELALIVNQVAHRLSGKRRVTQALLITGARGTGKQVVAREAQRLLATLRAPADVPFRQVSAPSLADGTGAADLFGVVDRYATDVKARKGYFEQATGGVLFFDEVADTPLADQAKLLNALEEREVTPLGGQRAVPFNCLVVSATNRDLDALVAAKTFRADLLDRLGRFRVSLPPLRERREDIPFLAQALLERHGDTRQLPWDCVEVLIARPWSGNVRELDACIERMIAIAAMRDLDTLDRGVCEAALEGAARAGGRAATQPLPSVRSRGQAPPREELLERLEAAGWNKTEVARQYGKHPRQVSRWMTYLEIERPA